MSSYIWLNILASEFLDSSDFSSQRWPDTIKDICFWFIISFVFISMQKSKEIDQFLLEVLMIKHTYSPIGREHFDL